MDIAKNYQDEDSEFLVWGNEVHKAAELALTKGTELPIGMPSLQSWVDKIKDVPYDKLMVEQKLAITKNFTSCGYFDKPCWFRTKADVLGISGPVALAIDWKTGKLVEDNQQLALMAAACFANFPKLQKIRTEFVWLKEGPDVSTRETSPGPIWLACGKTYGHVLKRQLEHAYNTNTYPAKPGGLCRYIVARLSRAHTMVSKMGEVANGIALFLLGTAIGAGIAGFIWLYFGR